MDWYGHGIGGWGYGLTALLMILFWAAVIYGIVALVRCARPNGTQGPEPSSRPSDCSPSDSPAARSTRTNTTSASQACEPQAPQVPSDGPDQLAAEGPALGRPLADRVKGSRYHNMKELRPRRPAPARSGCCSRSIPDVRRSSWYRATKSGTGKAGTAV